MKSSELHFPVDLGTHRCSPADLEAGGLRFDEQTMPLFVCAESKDYRDYFILNRSKKIYKCASSQSFSSW